MHAILELLSIRTKLSDEERYILDNPPAIIKCEVEYLISFSDKRKKRGIKPPRKQNAWLIFLKNYRVYLKEVFPDMSSTIERVSSLAADEWKKLKDNDHTKRYFKILEKIAEENRKMTFLENDGYIDTIKTTKKLKWKKVVSMR